MVYMKRCLFLFILFITTSFKLVQAQELPDRKARWHEYNLVRNEPLLEYVWEVALEFNEAPTTLVGHTKTSFAPTIFANRYAESKLSPT